MVRVAILCLLLTGCGEVARTWNPGGVPTVTVSSAQMVHRDGIARGAPCAPGSYIAAWCDRSEREIRLPDAGDRRMLVALAYHEFGHDLEDEYPAIWKHLNAMAAPDFPCGEDGDHDGSKYRKALEKTK